MKRLEERTVDRDVPIKAKAFQAQLKAVKKWGRGTPDDLSTITPDSGHGGILQFHEKFAPVVVEFLAC